MDRREFFKRLGSLSAVLALGPKQEEQHCTYLPFIEGSGGSGAGSSGLPGLSGLSGACGGAQAYWQRVLTVQPAGLLAYWPLTDGSGDPVDRVHGLTASLGGPSHTAGEEPGWLEDAPPVK